MPSDTHPAIEARMIEWYRQMTPAQKMERVQALNETVLQMAAARIRAEYQPETEHELRLRLACLWLDDETMRRVFDWDPAAKGR